MQRPLLHLEDTTLHPMTPALRAMCAVKGGKARDDVRAVLVVGDGPATVAAPHYHVMQYAWGSTRG